MKFNTATHKDRNSDWELKQIQILNSDQNRVYPEFDRNPKSYRAQILLASMPMVNRFAFVRQTACLARKIHNSRSSRFAHSVNAAIKMVAGAAPTHPAQPLAQQVAA